MKIFITFLFLLFYINLAIAGKPCGACHEEHYAEIATCASCHRGVDGTRRKEIAHYKIIPGKYAKFLLPNNKDVKLGKELISNAKCTRCHTIGGSGGVSASNLDTSIARLEAKEIFDAIQNPSENMPNFNLSIEHIDIIINTLYHNNRTISSRSSAVQTVHLSNNDNLSIFNEKCGGCHKLLSSNGVFGDTSLAPNLSSLLSESSIRINNKPWNIETFKQWIKNPRKVKSSATMPLIELNDNETSVILEMFQK